MPRKKKPVIEYRHYSLPIQFPVLLLSGERWKISDIKSEHLHFHNHLEIGICYSDSGIMEIKGESVPFSAGDVTFLPVSSPYDVQFIGRGQSVVLSLFLAGGSVSAFLQKRIQQLRAEPVGGTGNELYSEQGDVPQSVYPCHIHRRGIAAAEALLSGECLRVIAVPVHRTA